MRGHGRAEVTATGPRSEIGKIGLEDGRVWEQWFWWADWGISRRSCIQRGTEGSNLASSRGESATNRHSYVEGAVAVARIAGAGCAVGR